ncbi:pyridoxamine 5'-phosphate oxidase family protein [uncultured Mycolicibacterium sp.]|uniref:pyridoxamine 5'-phosphate oxidase family protein n=1 Tax=uncultured Mycolicibacterium sp. TaxID=2320817 RepID=UPI002603EC5E|nr:pyridoxamine 5'-phosphate oxidase family protein [uncultured Mycolicibacterium sp.]
MSVKVDLDRLADVLGDYPFGYLVSVGDDYRPHTVAVEPTLRDGRLDLGPVGRHTRRNTARHPEVTVVWPPRQAGGYSLIVDARALPADGESLCVEPLRAVLHRRAAATGAATSPDGLHDCVPIERPN